MIEPSVPRQVVRTLPKYRWGQPVTAAVDLYNDGSVPDLPEDVLLVAAGGP
nr:nitrogen fixation protein NifZ [Burkholderiaceae bacterium]